MPSHGYEEVSDLMEHEIEPARRILHQIQAKYQGSTMNGSNLNALEREAVQRFAEEVGLKVEVKMFGLFTGEPVSIEIVGRYNAFDLERDMADKRSGVAKDYRDEQRDFHQRKKA